MTSQAGLQLGYTNCPISYKGNQTAKFDQLIEYNKRNIVLQKLCGKWYRETSSRPLMFF